MRSPRPDCPNKFPVGSFVGTGRVSCTCLNFGSFEGSLVSGTRFIYKRQVELVRARAVCGGELSSNCPRDYASRGLTARRNCLWVALVALDEWVSYQIFVVTLNIAILLTLAVSGRQVQHELIKIVHILQSSPLLQQHQKKKMLNTSQKSTAVPKKRSLSIWGGIKGLAHVCSTRSD